MEDSGYTMPIGAYPERRGFMGVAEKGTPGYMHLYCRYKIE
jgi:hypothetical protein